MKNLFQAMTRLSQGITRISLLLLPLWAGLGGCLGLLSGCARMGNPDGGWYDETPPRVVASSPSDRGTGVTSRKVSIYFNEYIKLDNAAEKVVISPPQMEEAEIKSTGKRVTVQLKDTLQPNTTYTIDFSDAISDNNEGNPMGAYTFTFSTGGVIDTLQVAGYVLEAENLEPIKGILVGLFRADEQTGEQTGERNGSQTDSVPPFLRVSRTDSRGYFSIRGVAPGRYTVGALQDADGDYRFTQLSEKMAFSHDIVEPSSFMDTRQDTVWADALHIKDIKTTPFIHYTPDNVVLRAFTHQPVERHYVKAERKDADRFTLFFTAPMFPDSLLAFKERCAADVAQKLTLLPTLRPLNFNGENAFAVEPSERGDTVTYWLRDTAVVNQDTLRIEMTTLLTDTLGTLQMLTDTLEILAKTPYAKRLKDRQKTVEEWQKKVEKKRKRLAEGETLAASDTIMPPVFLRVNYAFETSMVPDGSVRISFPAPMQRVSTDSVHLYVEQDSLWYRAPFTIEPMERASLLADTAAVPRDWELYTDWIPGARYSLEVDSMAFEDIYGHVSAPYKSGIMVRQPAEFASLFVNVAYDMPADTVAAAAAVIVELLDSNGKPVRSERVKDGTAEFYYVVPGSYYMRALIDRNGNGRWDTGNFAADIQPEEVYYYSEAVECKAKWDLTKTWNLTQRPLYQQKPSAIVKQKAEAAKKRQFRNAARAAEKGVPMPVGK